MIISQSPRHFLERRGVRETRRMPTPLFRTDNPVHAVPLSGLLPSPRLSLHESGSPPPDRVQTRIWPHGAPPDA